MLFLQVALIASLSLTPTATAATPDTITIAVMGTTDVHGRILPWDYYQDVEEPRYALSKVATLVDSVRQVHPNTLLLDAGDWFQGNALAEYFARVDSVKPYPFLAAVDRMRYDAIVLGNHEFNFGIDLLNRRIVQTETPVIGANIYSHGTDVPAYLPYVIRDMDGVRVAVIGLTTPGSAVWDRPRVEGRLDFGDGLEAARRFVPEVRAQGADVVIILAHSGLDGDTSYPTNGLGPENFGRMIAEQVEGIDLLVLGHTHRVTNTTVRGPDGRYVGVIQAGRWGDHLALAEVSFVEGQGVVDQQLRVHPVVHAESHPDIEALAADGHEAVREYMATPIARTTGAWPTRDARLGPSAAVSLIHAAQRESTGAQLSAAAAFTTSLTMGPDVITLGQLTQLYPYENALYVVEISGAHLRAFLEHSARFYLVTEDGSPQVNREVPGFNFDMIDGVEYALDLSRPVGERVVRLEYEGRPVQGDDSFTMAVNSYRAEGGGGFPGMRDANVIQRIDRSVRDIIADYLRERGQVNPDEIIARNWRIVQ
jgi:2',3'-cyclic-nucleotide 2'-phosphodiesterase (5'-nucleotidase family)